MTWRRIISKLRKRNVLDNITKYLKSILDKCIIHTNSLYIKRYIYRHTYNVITEKIRKGYDIINTKDGVKIQDLVNIVDSVVYSCSVGTLSETLDYLGAAPLSTGFEWIDTLCVPIVISKERGGINSSFFRSPAIISSNSKESTNGIWVSVPGRGDHHFAIKLIVESDVCGILKDVFSSKIRMLTDVQQNYIHLLPEKKIITESVSELRSRIDKLLKTRERLGKTPVSKIIQEFMNADIPKQVLLLTSMIIKENNQDLTHLVTVIYDINANRTIANRRDIPDLIDSLPWEVQRRIRELRKHQASADALDETDIPTETRIQMLNTDDSTKKLAISRLKESNLRSGGGGGGVTGNDGSSKAGLWVEGLLRIPFGVIRKEPILCLREQILNKIRSNLGEDSNYIECSNDLYEFLCSYYPELVYINTDTTKLCWTREVIFDAIRKIDKSKAVLKLANDLGVNIVSDTRVTRRVITQAILSDSMNHSMKELYDSIIDYGGEFPDGANMILECVTLWEDHTKKLGENIENTRKMLDKCVHKQEHAKDQVLRIMGQWMVGENNGYCLGFEGPPGVGKTTLAREGIAKILTDADGNPRPFHMIALGTATTGSTLVGHNYTYHGSTWGDIVRILMDSQCMNPIIYIDELDKVSKTDSGREIIGILTHLTDPAQNEEFQDRYFAGVKLDLSKVLFVFSYNDPALIDSILLDRVHRVKFEPLTITDKVDIATKYTLPQICKSLRLPKDTTQLDQELVRYIVRNYTQEAGVRKLREILFDTYRELNLRNLTGSINVYNPTIEFMDKCILKHRSKPHNTIADRTNKVDRVYGMFATSTGIGGILPIKICSSKVGGSTDIHITGSLGDVMKESVTVARTVASRFTDVSGAIHIHFPEGATPKDGPSAGSAITLAMYSHYTNTEIPGDLAITGEIDLDGSVLPVGGIQQKITGAYADNIRRVILPEENRRDFEIACEKIPRNEMPEYVEFVNNFQELLDKVFNR